MPNIEICTNYLHAVQCSALRSSARWSEPGEVSGDCGVFFSNYGMVLACPYRPLLPWDKGERT